MRKYLSLGAHITAAAAFVACGLDLGGPGSDTTDAGGDVTADVAFDSGTDSGLDVTYDVPDLGMMETEAGIPCTCVPPIPSGWSLVTYEQTARDPCPMYYMSSQDTVENPTGMMTCQCNCTGVNKQGTCTTALNLTIAWGPNNTCGAGTQAINNITPGCMSNGFDLSGADFSNVKLTTNVAPSPTGATCNAPMTANTKGPVTSDKGRYCSGVPVANCVAPNVCVADVPMTDRDRKSVV